MSDSWRDLIDVHPAAECSPRLDEAEFEELADDIEKNGLQIPPLIVYGEDGGHRVLLDGRHRLDALERLGYEFASNADTVEWTNGEKSGHATVGEPPDDPYAVVMSLNAFRRHLTPKQKRELIAKLVAAQPEKSNRAIASQAGVSHPTVAAVRREREQAGDVEKLSTRMDRAGRRQPARRRVRASKAEPEPSHEPVRKTAVENPATVAPDASGSGQASPNGTEPAAKPVAEISEASGRERDDLVETLRTHLRLDPAVFLSDIAATMADQPGLLLDIPETNRREAIEMITRALGLDPRPEAKPDKPRSRTTHFVRRS
jgi:ParB-like chromosome segregation protein Spo0J